MRGDDGHLCGAQGALQLESSRYCLALRNIMALAKVGPTGQKKSMKKKRERRSI
jgi:hypothetical protein